MTVRMRIRKYPGQRTRLSRLQHALLVRARNRPELAAPRRAARSAAFSSLSSAIKSYRYPERFEIGVSSRGVDGGFRAIRGEDGGIRPPGGHKPGAIRTGPLFRNAISAVEIIEQPFRQDRGRCRNKLAGKRTTLVLANSREMADLATFENNKLELVLASSSLTRYLVT